MSFRVSFVVAPWHPPLRGRRLPKQQRRGGHALEHVVQLVNGAHASEAQKAVGIESARVVASVLITASAAGVWNSNIN